MKSTLGTYYSVTSIIWTSFVRHLRYPDILELTQCTNTQEWRVWLEIFRVWCFLTKGSRYAYFCRLGSSRTYGLNDYMYHLRYIYLKDATLRQNLSKQERNISTSVILNGFVQFYTNKNGILYTYYRGHSVYHTPTCI